MEIGFCVSASNTSPPPRTFCPAYSNTVGTSWTSHTQDTSLTTSHPQRSYKKPLQNSISWIPFLLSSQQYLFFHGILRWSVAVSTMRRQSSRIAAFLQADARPMFCWPRSASTVRSQVWLGLPNSHFQSGYSFQITAATAWWWSSCIELREIWPKSRKRLSVTRWERDRHLMVAWTSMFVTWWVCGINSIKAALSTTFLLLNQPVFPKINSRPDWVLRRSSTNFLGVCWSEIFFWTRCPSCRPTKSVKELKEALQYNKHIQTVGLALWRASGLWKSSEHFWCSFFQADVCGTRPNPWLR